MYIQITNRCNMTCAHCCFACTARGRDMCRDTWLAALALARKQDEHVTIGGGEPTLHPLFWEFVGLAFSMYSAHWPENGLFVVTNGSNTKSALALAAMAKAGIIGAALSQDRWHDPIHHDVPEAFRKTPVRGPYGTQFPEGDHREIRTISHIIGVGRAKGWGAEGECACDGLFVDPCGRLWSCGCRKLQFGTVFEPDIPDAFDNGECWKTTKRAMREEARA